MTPLLFLDFDGVLHPASAHQSAPFSRAPLLVEALAERDVAIVLSSSWRFGYEYPKLLAFLPAALSRRVVGMTGEPQFGEHGRYQEILHWLRGRGAGRDWRALDDAAFEFPERCPELILCDPNVGIDQVAVRELHRWLNGIGRG